MRRPSPNQRLRTYAKPTTSQRAMGKCRAVSLSVSLFVGKGKMLAKTAAAAKGSASQSALLTPDPRFQMK